MQNHKPPLDFAESPYHGARHLTTPVFAAEKPLLVEESVPAEHLNSKWVSPQFCDDIIVKARQDQRQRISRQACKKIAKQRRTKDVVHFTENNIFPELHFPEKSAQNVKSKCTHARSDHSKTSREAATMVTKRCQVPCRNSFLFRLGTPKPRKVLGEILVPETPEDQMVEHRMLHRQLQNSRKI